VRAVREWIVERVEVRADRNRRAFRVHGSVLGDVLLEEPRRRLDRSAVSDAPGVAELSLDARVARHVPRALRDGLRVLRHVEPGTKGRLDALGEVEVEVPRLEILEHV